MWQLLFASIGLIFLLVGAGKAYIGASGKTRLHSTFNIVEHGNFVLFAAFLAAHLYFVLTQNAPALNLFWLFLAFCLCFVNILTELLYASQITGLFSNAMAGTVLLLLGLQTGYDPANLEWLAIHRVIFLLAYSFCLLALPLSFQFLFKRYILEWLDVKRSGLRNRKIAETDRVLYQMILWSVPLLTLGIFWRIVSLLDSNYVFHPITFWQSSFEDLLALATWCSCSLFIFTRVFLGWRRGFSVSVYLGGFVFVFLFQFGRNWVA